MPTGYTYKVEDGDITKLSDFIRECSKAFLFESRDDSSNTLEKSLNASLEEESSYYKKSLKETEERILNFPSLNTQESFDLYNKEKVEEEQYLKKSLEDAILKKSRYQNMIDLVYQWNPSPEYSDLKNFMISQLNLSSPSGLIDYYSKKSFPDYKRWYSETTAQMLQDQSYFTENLEKENSRKEKYKAWIEGLLKELENVD